MPPEQLKLALDEANDLIKSLRPASRAIAVVVKALELADESPLRELSKKIGALERVAEKQPLRRAVPSLEGAVAEAKQTFDDISRQRSDTLRRREGIAALAAARGLSFRHMDRSDWLGPIQLDHSATTTVLKLGRVTLARMKTPSPTEVVARAEKVKAQLERDARKDFEPFAEAAYRRQQELSGSEPVRWKELVEHVMPDQKERRRRAALLLYRLALLVFGEAPGGWVFKRVPPPLSEQREAIEVPDPRHPGESERIVRGRLRR